MRRVMLDEFDIAERRLQRLEHRYRCAQNAAVAASALYSALRDAPNASAAKLRYAERQMHEAQRYLKDL